jgi:hypothetical protein
MIFVLKKPYPSQDGDGKPRVSTFSVESHLKRIYISEDSRAAEFDIVNVTVVKAGQAFLFHAL